MKISLLTAGALALASISAPAFATTLTNGNIQMGLFDDGGLGSESVGLNLAGTGDAITPGCLCEGWGVAGDGTGRYTYGGFNNFTSAAISGVTASGAVSTVDSGLGLSVVHTYTPIAGKDLFKVHIDITNTTLATIADVRYARTLDWDVPPNHFSDDFTTIYGGPAGIGGKILHTSVNPFAEPDPTVTRGTFCGTSPDTNVVDTPGDCGGYFIFGFGSLAAGATTSFDTIIGAAGSPAALLAQFSALNVEAYSYTYDNDFTTTFGYGFVGVGLPPIPTPEPAALALFGFGIVGLAAARRRK